VNAAGGATPNARLSALNLAARLSDGMQIYLPLEGEEVPTASVSSGASALSDRISINQATATDLERLPGIGPVLAASIIEHRDTSGPFQTEDDLLQVTGIGPSKLDAIRDLILIP
jgi:competence protein ComEA